ncbi:MAG: HlyD family efflux transporter periplasmic adaptor subunit [Planctomycetes bacterium]|nr:HlyD family efflux transporter periplasmic adaptor subunit [Planctomycetota bacterium]
MKKSRKWILVIVGVLLVGGLAYVGAKRKAKGSQAATSVRLENPALDVLTESISAPGEIEAQTNVEISAKVSARILALPFDEGDRVTKGDPDSVPPIPPSVLVRLDDRDLKSRLRSAEANRQAQAAQIQVEAERTNGQCRSLEGLHLQLKQRELDLGRQAQLLASQDVSQSAYDEAKLLFEQLETQVEAQTHTCAAAQLNLEVLQYRLDAADASIEQAKEALGHTVITAPINGVITRLNAEVGEIVMTGTMNNAGTVILEVADLSRMLVVAQVGEADVGKLGADQKAKVTVQAFPDDTFYGKLDTIALKHRMSNTGTKYYRTEILMNDDPNVAKLYTGLTAHVEIETLTHQDVLTVPSQAVLAHKIDDLPLKIRKLPEVEKDKTVTTVVYRFVDGKAKVTPVTLGSGNLTHRIITAGLSPEDRIVIGPYRVLDDLKHDQAIKDEELEASKDKADPNDPNDT